MWLCTSLHVSHALSLDTLIGNRSSSPTANEITEVGTEGADPYKRSTPHGTVKGIFDALKKRDFTLLGAYLDPEFVKKYANTPAKKERLLYQLSDLLNKHADINPKASLSNNPVGQLDDGLPEDQEMIGYLLIDSSPSILLVRKNTRTDSLGTKKVWLLSSRFLQHVPAYHKKIAPTLIDRWLPKSINISILGVSIGHLLACFIILLVAFFVGALMSAVTLSLFKLMFFVFRKHLFSLRLVFIPIALIIATSAYRDLSFLVGIDQPTRTLTQPVVNLLSLLSLAWLAYRLIEAFSAQFEYNSVTKRLKRNLSAVYLLKGIAKAVVVVGTLLLILNNFGVNIASGVALLGLGGLALALGAQKTVENFVGSIVVVTDQPINIGDYCRFGSIEGTVEDIGIRSTRIRTLARTLVTIPNGEFSSMQIENYSKRDRFLFNHTFAFGLDTSKQALEHVMQQMRELLTNHDDAYFEASRVRLRFTERDCFKVEVFCYIKTSDFADFLAKQERLLLLFIDLINHSEVDLALPVQLINEAG